MLHFSGYMKLYIFTNDVLNGYVKAKPSNKTFAESISSADSVNEDDSTFYLELEQGVNQK